MRIKTTFETALEAHSETMPTVLIYTEQGILKTRVALEFPCQDPVGCNPEDSLKEFQSQFSSPKLGELNVFFLCLDFFFSSQLKISKTRWRWLA